MTDLILNDYKDCTEGELKQILQAEIKKMFHSNSFEHDLDKSTKNINQHPANQTKK